MTELMLLTIASSSRGVFICRRLFRERPCRSWLALRIVGQEWAHPPGLIGEGELRPHMLGDRPAVRHDDVGEELVVEDGDAGLDRLQFRLDRRYAVQALPYGI